MLFLLITTLISLSRSDPQQINVCFNTRFQDALLPYCSFPPPGSTLAGQLPCYRHPTTGLNYIYPPARMREHSGSGHLAFKCTGTYRDNGLGVTPSTTVLPMDGVSPIVLTDYSDDDVNDECPCLGIGNGQHQLTKHQTLPAQNYQWDFGGFLCDDNDVFGQPNNQTSDYCLQAKAALIALGAPPSSDGCPVAIGHSGCQCTPTEFFQVSEYNLGGTWVVPAPCSADIYVSITDIPPIGDPLKAPWGYNPPDIAVQQFRRTMERTLRSFVSRSPRSSVTSTSLDGTALIVNTPTPGATRVLAVKDGHSQIYLCAERMCVNILPDPYFFNSGTLSVRVYINDTLDSEVSLPVSAFVMCPIPRCVMCLEMYNDFSCFPWEVQATIIVIMILAIVSSVLVLLCIIKGGRTIKCCPGACKGAKKMVMKVFRRGRSAGNEETEMLEVDSSVDMTKFGDDFRPKPSIGTVFLIFLLALPLALGQTSCSSGITISVANELCSVSGTIETCSVEFQTVMTLPGPGLSACLTFKKLDDTVLGTFNITYDQMLQIAPLQTLYWTSDYRTVTYSQHQCAGSLLCGSCAQYDPVTNPRACTTSGTVECLLPDTFSKYPRVSRCDSVPGCVTNGCFFCDPGCIYSSAAFIPQAPYCQVQAPTSLQNRPQLTAHYRQGSEVLSTKVDVVSGSVQVGANFTLSIVGSLQGSQSFLNSQNVVQCTDGVSGMGFASPVGIPTTGRLGDIQANSLETLTDLNGFPQFIFDQNIISPLPTASVTNYVVQASGMYNRQFLDSFPTPRGSTLWTVNGYYMYGIDAAPGAVVFTMQTSTPYVLTRTVNVVCPKIVSANISGCYSCDQGSTITLRAYSRCSSGGAVVTASGDYVILTPSVVLESGEANVLIRVAAGKNAVSGTITLTSGPYSDSILVEGLLVAEALIGFNNATFYSNSSGHTSPSTISGFFFGLPDWQGGLIVAAIVIASIVVGIALLCIGSKVLTAFIARRAAYSAVPST